MDYSINSLFPCPIYETTMKPELDSEERKDIKNIVEYEMDDSSTNWVSIDTFIFDTRLPKLKKFIKTQIQTYVDEVINPKKELNLEFFITQSWIFKVEPGGYLTRHDHPNSLLNGVFYISTIESDKINFYDPSFSTKTRIDILPERHNVWNSTLCSFNVHDNKLLLFPSWLEHSVNVNPMSSTDRISISFNVFVRGNISEKENISGYTLFNKLHS